MKTLIAVVSCHSRPMYRQAIRETWLPLVPRDKADVKFFVGGEIEESDTVTLECDDSYEGLPSKVQAIVRWALAHGYDYVLKCDDDVVLQPDKLLASGYDAFDFVGHRNDSHEVPIPPYGFCYWLSKRSMEIVATSTLPRDNFDEGWIRHQLYAHSIVLHHDPRYFLHFGRKEDFIPKRRPVRFNRPEAPPPVPAEGTFAWCMYIPWLGVRRLPHDMNIREFHKVFATNVANCK